MTAIQPFNRAIFGNAINTGNVQLIGKKKIFPGKNPTNGGWSAGRRRLGKNTRRVLQQIKSVH
jgi:hypothetical protein